MNARFEHGFFIGSEGDDGEHIRGTDGWPFSIYRKGKVSSGEDVVLCHGIQCLDDAEQLLALCNGTIRPPIAIPCQVFAWD